MGRKSLTGLAHRQVAACLQAGEIAVDATAGNGHDALFLANTVGEQGHVYAFDIQTLALENTRQRLQAHGLRNVTLLPDSHDRMHDLVPSHLHGNIKAIMFNLGYLPGSDKTCITRLEPTLKALDSAQALLGPGGIISVIGYRGHPGGDEETGAVLRWVSQLPADRFKYEIYDSHGPVLMTVFKLRDTID